ncbi:synaptotagmin-like protein 1 [Clarias gariepinus]|uniref:synaptotagmin-like protein 1 n=1 Tax=Clarias gariepinus TaxID=13013 RepID=UPI00234D77C6|nr:synaptotagmin-like protein 1 [Clarias gariepinus]
MRASRDATIFIDLSFLSPEEEAIIQKVLVRDEDLKKHEIGRVRKLRERVPDQKELKVLSGEWFEDLKSKRYGRQPHVSAVVRSSMRWKKTAGHNTNPFLKAVPGDKGGEKNKTRPDVTTDPRSIHPALSVQVQQENKDEAIVLEESSGSELNKPVLKVIEAGHQSGPKPQEQTSFKMEPMQESKMKEVDTKIWDTRDPGRTELKEDWVVKTNLQNRPKQTDEKPFRNFEIRSFSQAQESGNWGFGQLVAEEELIKPQSKVEVVKINSNNRTEIEVKNKQECPRPRESSILINSGSGFEEKIQSPVPKKRSSDHIKVINVNSKQTTPTRKEVLSVDLDMKKDPGVLEDLKPSPVNNVNTEVYFNVDHKSLDPVQKRKGSAVQEFMVDEQRSSRRTEELSVDLDQRRSPDVSIGPVSNVNPEIKYISLDKSLDPVQKGKERAVEEILVADFKQRSSTRTEELSVDLDVKNNSDISEAPGYNLNTEKSVNWKQKTFDPPRKGKEEVVEEIVVQEIKQRSPKRLEERIIDINVEENPDVVEDLKTRQVQKDVRKYERVLADTKSDELPDSVMKNRKNEAAGGKNGFDVKLRESESTNQKVSKEIEAMEKGGRGDENGISESDILASVYARATRPKPGVSKSAFSQEPMQKTVEVIPAIVIVPSESEEPKETELVKNETPTPEAVVDVEKAGADIWEDVAVDSDEDSSSASSHDSDLSGKRSQVSATTLSVKERTASLLSVYSDAGDFGNVAVQGSVEFAIMYSPLGELVIMVEQCQDLAIANTRKQRTDPYVKTYLYPDKRSKRKTSIKKHTVNPVFVESLRYKVKREELHGKTLNLSVWHNDSRGRNAFLGQVEINLKDWNWKHEAVTWYNLQPKTADILESQEYRGVLFVSLKYVPAEATGGSRISQPTGEIHIWLREAKHLRRLKAQGVDSFVKCYMLPDTSKKSRQKTRVVKKTQDPVYNHTMVYDGFRVGELCEACCELTVWDNHKLSNQFLGGVRLSLGTGQSYGKKVDWMDSENEEVEIWKKMMANPNSWVEGELSLRASMTPRK